MATVIKKGDKVLVYSLASGGEVAEEAKVLDVEKQMPNGSFLCKVKFLADLDGMKVMRYVRPEHVA
jgi:hypothetical protein